MNKRIIYKMSICYLALPMFIFFVGYLKWYVALVALLIAFVSCWQVCCQVSERGEYKKTGQWYMLIAALMITYLLGVGGYFTQSSDWMAKNPVLNDLVCESWPVIVYPQQMSKTIQEVCGTQPVALVYYFFYYLPAACVGKLAGLGAAHFALFVWTVLGLWLLQNLLLLSLNKVSLSKKNVVIIILLFVVFGGGDFLGHILRLIVLKFLGVSPLYATWRIDEWCRPYFSYYGAHWTSLYWCFNQAIPIWLLTAVIVCMKDVKTIGFFYSFTLLYSPWAAMGMLPLVFGYVIFTTWKNPKAFVRLFTVSNVLFPLMLLGIVGSFYMSNNHPLADKGWFWEFESPLIFSVKYIVFLAIELGVYAWILRKRMVTDTLLALAFITLLFVPFYKMTAWNDFMMRASLPTLFIVFMYWMNWCLENWNQRKKAILVICAITSLTALQLIGISVVQTIEAGKPVLTNAEERFCHTNNIEVAKLGEGQFFAHGYDSMIFWKYLAR